MHIFETPLESLAESFKVTEGEFVYVTPLSISIDPVGGVVSVATGVALSVAPEEVFCALSTAQTR